jgi:N-acetylglutamate synthase-like GNAT family acetyltransferase
MRKAEKKDIPQLIELMRQLGYQTTQEALEKNLACYGEAVLVKEKEGKVIACLAFHILPQFHSRESHMRIVSLIVDEKHRGQGIGSEMLQKVEEMATAKGCTAIELTSASHRIPSGAHAFYHDLGYKSDGEKVYFLKRLSLRS